VQRSGAVAELAVQDQERQAAEVVAVQVRHQHQPDLVGIVALLLQGDQGGGAAVQQDVAILAGGPQQNARLEAAAAAEGITRADEPHLDRVLGHTLTLPCADPGCVGSPVVRCTSASADVLPQREGTVARPPAGIVYAVFDAASWSVSPHSRATAASPSGLPGQCRRGGCRPARRTPEQSTQVTMMVSSV
jgi:hypothetical protein